MSPRFAFLERPGVAAFSHRGGTSEWPENTIPAFQYSIDLGYKYLETDVHLSADDVLFAFHDDNLLRTTGVHSNIADLESHEIEKLLVDGRARIPRLEEVLTTWPQARVNIDPKSDAAVLPLIDAIDRCGVIDRVCVGSFSDRRIALCRERLGPELCTSMGRREAVQLRAASLGLADPSRLRAACAQLPIKSNGMRLLDEQLVSTAHDCNIEVHAWTIDEPDVMTELLDLGIDGLMTDQPVVLRQVLIQRGDWSIPGVPL